MRVGGYGLLRKYRRCGPCPVRGLEALERRRVKVSQGSTIRVLNNVYSSAGARLIGEWVEAWVGADQIRVRTAQQEMVLLPRLRGQEKASHQLPPHY